MTQKIIVYTAIFGGYDNLRPPTNPKPGIRYLCFSDSKQSVPGWETIRVTPGETPSVRMARRVKVLAHAYLPSDTDCSIWVDGCTLLLPNHDPRGLCERYLINQEPESYHIAVIKHAERDCVWQEAGACIVLRKDTPANIQRQMAYYVEQEYPRHAGMVETNVLLRRHNATTEAFNVAWWDVIERFTHRDQLSFNYVAYMTETPYAEIMENPRMGTCSWAQWLPHTNP